MALGRVFPKANLKWSGAASVCMDLDVLGFYARPLIFDCLTYLKIGDLLRACPISLILTSNQVGLRAELKHINKRRKRN